MSTTVFKEKEVPIRDLMSVCDIRVIVDQEIVVTVNGNSVTDEIEIDILETISNIQPKLLDYEEEMGRPVKGVFDIVERGKDPNGVFMLNLAELAEDLHEYTGFPIAEFKHLIRNRFGIKTREDWNP